MKIATESEFALYMIVDNTRMINPAHARIGDTITVPGENRGVKVKTIDLSVERCRPECVHINGTLCYDMRVDVQVKRG